MPGAITIQFNRLAQPMQKTNQTKTNTQPQTHQDCNYKESHKEADKHHNQLNAREKGRKKGVQDKLRSHKGQLELFHFLL